MLTNKLPLPAIAHVIIDDSLLHYMVITKVKDDTVVVFDPAKGIAKDIFGTFDQYVAPVQNFVREDELIKSFQWLLQNEQHIKQHYQKTMPDYKTNALLAAEFLKEI